MIHGNDSLNYWDYTPRQRALMSRDEVAQFIDFELMRKGVIKVETPILREVPDVEIKTTTFYSVGYNRIYSWEDFIIVSTPEEAQTILGMKLFTKDSSYDCGHSRYYAKRADEAAVKPIELMTQEDFTAASKILKEQAAAISFNDTVQKEYDKNAKAMDEATSGMFDDWTEQQLEERKAQTILSTWKRYLGMCKGQWEIAAEFLVKAHTREDIQKAIDWLGEAWDVVLVFQPVEQLQAEDFSSSPIAASSIPDAPAAARAAASNEPQEI